MQVQVMTHQCMFPVEIERIIHLFFEHCNVAVHDADDVQTSGATSSADIVIHLRLSQSGNSITVSGQLKMGDRAYSASFAKELEQTLVREAIRKRSKQVTRHTLHQLLEQATGEHQPWGILTGVRPLKLVHKMFEQGLSHEVVRSSLLSDHLIAPERADLLLEIAAVQRKVVPDLYKLDHEVSLYIGIPFCPTHCAYCTFPAYSMQEKATYVDDFLKAMDLEFAHIGRLLREYDIPVTSIYIGGGTPTSLRAKEMEWMMESIYREIPNPSSWREFTVEAGRPDTITPDRVAVMRKYGVNRISVNPQTFKAATLKEIGRGHTPDIVDHRFHYVREAGFENINMDMILGLPGESLDDVRYTMERIERLNPESVTVHTMSFKRSAVVKDERDRFAIPHSQVVRQMMAETTKWARSLGHHPYYVYRQRDILGNMENIGFAKTGKDSIYNICIMEERQTIVGIGGGASTKLIGHNAQHFGRFGNPREPKAFIDTIGDVIARKDAVLRKTFESIVEGRNQALTPVEK